MSEAQPDHPAIEEARPETDRFAARRLEGRGGALGHLGGALVIFVLWQVLSVVLILGVNFLGYPEVLEMIANGTNWVELAPHQDPAALALCAILLLSLVLLLLINWAVVRLGHKRSLMSVMTAHKRFQWRSAFISFAAYVVVMVAVSLVVTGAGKVLGFGAETQVIFDAGRFFPFLVLVLLLTPFQALAEEVFVRGYLFQGVSAFTRSVAVRIGLPAILFMLLHFANPDFKEGGLWAILIFLTFGVYFGWLTVKTAGVEAAAGAHTANNIFAFAVSTSGGAGMPFATIFYEPEPDYLTGLITILIVVIVHYMVFCRFSKS